MLTNFILLSTLTIILLLSLFIVNKIFPIEIENVTYKSIDGLRGYLAFFVFIHHSYISFVFYKTGLWQAPESNLFNQFGQTSVVFFFMITSFLFTNKLITAKNKPIIWKQLFLSRFLRLFPMYFFSILLLFLIVIIKSDFTINDKISHIIRDVFKWITFTISSQPDINKIKNTGIINAGIAWSLTYEWIFYFSLPLLAILFRLKPTNKVLIFSSLILVYIVIENKPNPMLFIAFVSGSITAMLRSKYNFESILSKTFFSFIIVGLLLLSIYFFNSGTKILPTLISTIVFILITFNNSIFGILHWNISRKLGQITYSIYLMHGIILFVVFNFIIGFENAKNFSFFEHWKIIAMSIFPILFICQLTYIYIEIPFMKLTNTFFKK